MGSLGRNRLWQPVRRAQAGDIVAPGELDGGHANAERPEIQGLSERGGGDMTDNTRHWINVRTHNYHCRLRLLSTSMNVLTVALIPMMIVSLFVSLNIGMALLSRWVSQEMNNGIKMEILGTINNGYVTSHYIYGMNEALYEALPKKLSETLLRDVRQLNEMYAALVHNIQRVIMESALKLISLPWNNPDLTHLWRWPVARYLSTFGWWAEDYSRPSLRLIFKTIRIIFLVVNIVYMLSLTIGVFRQMANSSNILDNLFSFFAAAPSYLGFGKIISTILQRRRLRAIWSRLDEMLQDVVNRGVDADLERELRWRYKRCWSMYSIFLTVGSCITLHWLLRPIVYAMYGERAAIVETWPVYRETWLQWFCTYVFQAMNISSVGHGLYMYDNVYFCTCENILVQFAVLKYHLNGMDISYGKPGGVSLEFCIAHHIKLTNICLELRSCTNAVILQQVFWTVFILCPGVFELASGRQTDATLVFNLMEIILIMTTILFFYSWYSNEVTYQSSQVYNSCYMSNWVQGGNKHRKSMLAMMTRSMKPIVYGGLVKVDLSTFITVLKTTFSYYQFLDKMDHGKNEAGA